MLALCLLSYCNYEIPGVSEMQFLPTTSPIMQLVISVGGCEVTTALDVNVNKRSEGGLK